MKPSTELATRFRQATSALTGGQTDEAIAKFESMADRSLVHPDVSFNRGVAYLKRALGPSSRDGDLGQAEAAFREALELRPADEAARGAADAVLLEVARRDSDRRDTQLAATDPLPLQILAAIPPAVPPVFAGVGALVLLVSFGLSFRARLRPRAMALMVLGAVCWLLGASLHLLSERFVDGARVAVVVVRRAELRDSSGRQQRGRAALGEGTRLRLTEQSGLRPAEPTGPLVQTSVNGETAYLRSSDVRILARPSETRPVGD